MSQIAPAPDEVDEGTPVEGEAPDYGPLPEPGWFVKARRNHLGLKVAPVGILALIGILYWYYQSLNLDASVNIQQASALDWSTKLWPQIQQHLWIAFWSTLLVVVIAIPLGIALTRPLLRRYSSVIVTVANSGQALPAYGLLILFLALMGQGARTVIVGLVVYALLPVLRTRWSGSTPSTAASSRPVAAWA
jgi:osmoprotectant transport system permease protein